MQKITTHLWFDKEAKEAAEFYTRIFSTKAKPLAPEHESKIKNTNVLEDTPSGSVDIVTMELCGQEFTLISAGPLFKFTPAISFTVACNNKEEVEALWGELSPGGQALMELGEYPYSEKYGWIQDRYGLSWQLIYLKDQPIEQKIVPALMYTGANAGKAEEAMNFYVSIFKNSKVGGIFRYGPGQQWDDENNIAHGEFWLEDQKFTAMDSAYAHKFNFNEAISLLVHCENQEEIDYYWDKLSAVPESEQCGWLKDKYGVSWQIVPKAMDKMFAGGDKDKIARVTQAFLKMKKFNIAELEKATAGE